MTLTLWTKKWAENTQKKFKFFETVKSSNTKAKNLQNIPEIPLLIIAQKQTHPYGRKNRAWIPSDFMATWTWKNFTTISPVFSPLVGLALYNSFQHIWPSDLWSLKAPNDIYLSNKKTAGLLIETQVNMDPRFRGGDVVTLAQRFSVGTFNHIAPAKTGIQQYRDVQVIFGLGINVLKAPPNTECIKNHHLVNESLWKNFLDCFWNSLNNLINRNVSEISLDELKSLKLALQKHPEYKELIQVLKDGSLIFKDKTIHWSHL